MIRLLYAGMQTEKIYLTPYGALAIGLHMAWIGLLTFIPYSLQIISIFVTNVTQLPNLTAETRLSPTVLLSPVFLHESAYNRLTDNLQAHRGHSQ